MRPSAVYMTDTNPVTFHEVYPDSRMEQIRELCDIPDEVITSANLEEHRALLAKTEYIFSTWGMLSLTEEQIAEYLPKLKAVFYAAGSVQFFARPFLNSGVKVFSAWAANAVPVAEYTVAQIILAGKGMFRDMRMMREAKEKHAARAAAAAYTRTLPCNYGTKVGILGIGMIGKLVLKMLKDYEFEVLAYDPFVSDEVLESLGARRASLEEIFSDCQIVSNHIANLPATVGMLNYDLFSLMKDNAVFINTGRGAQVVEDDLIRALQEKPDRTALLDVTWPEPPAEDSLLWELENVFLTPHIAGSLKNETARMSAYMLEEFKKHLAGERCEYEVSVEMLATMA